MPEIYRQEYAGENKFTSGGELTEVNNKDTLEHQFEEKWREKRQDRIVKKNADGTTTVFETYEFSIDTDFLKTRNLIVEFTSTAMMIGYRHSTNALVIPPIPRGFAVTTPVMIYFFLERTETESKQATTS